MTPEKFRDFRKNVLHYTQIQLGEHLGCDRNRIRRLENGTTPIGNETVYAVYWLAFHGPNLPGDVQAGLQV